MRRFFVFLVCFMLLISVSFADFNSTDAVLKEKLLDDVQNSGLKRDGFVRLNYWGESIYKLLVEQDFSMFRSGVEDDVMPAVGNEFDVNHRPHVKGILLEEDKELFREWLYEKSVEFGYVEEGTSMDFEDVFVNTVLNDKEAIGKYRVALMKIIKEVVDDTTDVIARVVGGGTGRLVDGNFSINIISPMNETSNIMFLGGTSYGVPLSADYMRVIIGDGFSKLIDIVPELKGRGYNDLYVPNIVYFYVPCSDGMRLITNSLFIKSESSSVILRGKNYPLELYLDNIGVYAVPSRIDIFYKGVVGDYDLVFRDEKFMYKKGDYHLYASDVSFPMDSVSAFSSKGNLYVEDDKGRLIVYVDPVLEEEQETSNGVWFIWVLLPLVVVIPIVSYILLKIFKRKRKNNMLEVFEDVSGGIE